MHFEYIPTEAVYLLQANTHQLFILQFAYSITLFYRFYHFVLLLLALDGIQANYHKIGAHAHYDISMIVWLALTIDCFKVYCLVLHHLTNFV